MKHKGSLVKTISVLFVLIMITFISCEETMYMLGCYPCTKKDNNGNEIVRYYCNDQEEQELESQGYDCD